MKSFNEVLCLFKDALPIGEILPKSYYKAKSVKKGNIKKQGCLVCGESRWLYDKNQVKEAPQKVLRHFALKLRLQGLFVVKELAE